MVPKGTVIYSGEPFAYIVKQEFQASRCDNCLQGGPLRKCSACKCISYCDPICQKKGWKIHKSECKNFKACPDENQFLPEEVRLMARIISRLNKGGRSVKDYYTETKYRTFDDLMSHFDEMKKDFKVKVIIFQLKLFMPQAAKMSNDELLDIYGKIDVNSFNMGHPNDIDDVGTGLYLAPSVIDHSCVCNVQHYNYGTTMELIITEDLPELDWSKLRNGYFKSLDSTEIRREKLMSRYYFSCDCKKCENPEPLAACSDSECLNYCDPNDKFCSKCGRKFPGDFKQKYDEVVVLTKKCLEDITHEQITASDTPRIKSCLSKQEGVLHRYNEQHLKTVHLAQRLAPSGEDAIFYTTKLLAGYREHFGECDMSVATLFHTLGKTYRHMDRFEESYEYLTHAQSILKVHFGKHEVNVKNEVAELLAELRSIKKH